MEGRAKVTKEVLCEEARFILANVMAEARYGRQNRFDDIRRVLELVVALASAAAPAILVGPPCRDFSPVIPTPPPRQCHATVGDHRPILNPKIDSGVPLRRALLPAAAGSSFTPASPPLGNRLTEKSI